MDVPEHIRKSWFDFLSFLGSSIYVKVSRLTGLTKGLTKQWKPWVNRVVNIRNTKSEWNHVPGNLNQADIPTRQISTHDLNADGVWLNGPSFLYSERRDGRMYP